MIYESFKKIAFCIDPELAHINAMGLLHRFPYACSLPFSDNLDQDKYAVDLGNLKWKFPVGLAAGLDKNAEAIDFFSRIPFGAIEVGTVTPKSQVGNEKPRLFRLPEEESLRNCMGFNNAGSDEIYNNIIESKKNGKILGVNLGKNKVTTAEDANLDYRVLYEKFCKVADYLVINVSSPNTPGLRDLQTGEGMRSILEGIKDLREKDKTPLYVKLSPDLADTDLESIITLLKEFNVDGVIATNTTIIKSMGAGGVSGKLLSLKASEIRKKILTLIDGDMEFIGVGGISSFDELFNFWKMGGKAVQIYTSFIYQGPGILNKFQNDIDKVLSYNDMSNVRELLNNIDKVKRPI